ncbi:hypothetical protein CFE53_03075 [Methanofervidicoccus sp. A16]|uniref:respiratory chain complex I subunit 1 family protein n=1 Tax=Methanofervidicoccus sp. A16 TaxID=2607662 RepID=UPI00118A087B|nr:NADH-quinone oxidoreductase subunit H [Methanofervidicoccus sp. A16]AXI25184.1 hypothetical protein CFE53_03075 [Methanofervidicoccus sp. A16]
MVIDLSLIEFILSIVGIPLIAFAVSTLIPGIQRKIQARIQRRIGPSILTPGLWALFKFLAKEVKRPFSEMPRLYNLLTVLGFLVVWVILAATTVPHIHVVSNIVFITGLLKVKEMLYIIMGSLSSSIMGVRMPISDICKGSNFTDILRMSLEQLGALRAYKLITVGSFPLYIGIVLPFISKKSIFLDSIVGSNFLFTLPGIFGAIAYFIGYVVLIGEYPFSIMHTKADVIEGPTLEYSGRYRAIYLSFKELLMITLGSLFATLYLGIYPDVNSPITIVINFGVAFLISILSSILGAYSPVLTFRQIYPISLYTSAVGFVGVLLALLRI